MAQTATKSPGEVWTQVVVESGKVGKEEVLSGEAVEVEALEEVERERVEQ